MGFLSYSDLQAEAEDLYTKHGFRTYIVSRYPIFYDLSDLGEAEYRKDVKKRISELNTDSKPYIVVDLNLEKDLDFKGEVIASSWVGYTGNKGSNQADRSSSGLDDDTKKAIELHAAANINYNGDKKLNPTETANGIEDFKRQLTPAYPNGDYVEYYDHSLDITAVRSLALEEKLIVKGDSWKSSTEYNEENGDTYGFYRFDKYFTGEDFSEVADAITAINTEYPNLHLTAAELKAYFAQESADYTCENMLGIVGNNSDYKTHGIVGWRTGNKFFAGITQMNKTSIEESMQWLQKYANITFSAVDKAETDHNVQLWRVKDPNISKVPEWVPHTYNLPKAISDPKKAILLGIGYMGRTLEILSSNAKFPVIKAPNGPKGVDLKNMLFGSYNQGVGSFFSKTKDAIADGVYNWFDIVDDNGVVVEEGLERKFNIKKNKTFYQALCTVSNVNLRLSENDCTPTKYCKCCQTNMDKDCDFGIDFK